MTERVRIRFWFEAVTGALAGLLGLLTLGWRDWIEAVFGVDPDQHNGTVEWVIVAGLLVVALALGGLAAIDRRRLAMA